MKIPTNIITCLTLCTSYTLLSSCDTSPDDSANEITISGRGFDVAALTANPTDTAPFPVILATGEEFTFNLPALPPIIEAEVLVLPTNTSGQIIVDRFNYNYTRGSSGFRDVTVETDKAQLRLSDIHSFDSASLEAQFASRVTSSIGIAGSLGEALLVDSTINNGFAQFNDQEVVIILNAAMSMGYKARINTISKRFEVRVDQVYSLESNQNNLDFVNNKELTGSVEENTQWRGLLFEFESDANGDVILGTRYKVIVQDGILSNETRSGTFTLKLKSLTEI